MAFGQPVEAFLHAAQAENGRKHRRLSPLRRRQGPPPQHVPQPNLPFGAYEPRLTLQQTRPYEWVHDADQLEAGVEGTLTRTVHGTRMLRTTFSPQPPPKSEPAMKLTEAFVDAADPTLGARDDFGDKFKRFPRPSPIFDRGTHGPLPGHRPF